MGRGASEIAGGLHTVRPWVPCGDPAPSPPRGAGGHRRTVSRDAVAGSLGTAPVTWTAVADRSRAGAAMADYSAAGTFRCFLRAQLLGYLGNVLLPLRGGEVVRVLAATSGRVTLEGAVVSSAIMRLKDVPVLLSLGLCSVYVNPTHFDATLLVAPLAGSVVLVLGMPVLAALGRWACRNASDTRFTWLASSRWIARRCRALLEALPGPSAMVPSQAISLACWLLYVISPIPLFPGGRLAAIARGDDRLGVHGDHLDQPARAHCTSGNRDVPRGGVAAIALAAPELSASAALAIAVVVHLIGTVGIALPGVYLLPALFSGALRSRGGGTTFAPAVEPGTGDGAQAGVTVALMQPGPSAGLPEGMGHSAFATVFIRPDAGLRLL
ncbi:MAG: hypothetical protein HC888_08125 [Candidatus Competibacteraceae bacterium]|nr:hypothetical protein [Candidatus Competibacteraceae bacterium]